MYYTDGTTRQFRGVGVVTCAMRRARWGGACALNLEAGLTVKIFWRIMGTMLCMTRSMPRHPAYPYRRNIMAKKTTSASLPAGVTAEQITAFVAAREGKAPAPAKGVFFLEREHKGQAPTRITAMRAPDIKELHVGEALLRGVAGAFLLNGPDEGLLKNTWGESLKSHRSLYVKLCKEVQPASARAAWNVAVEAAERKREVSLSGLVRACKEAGLIAKGESPAKKEETTESDARALARQIVAILSAKVSPAAKLKAIAELHEVKAVIDENL